MSGRLREDWRLEDPLSGTMYVFSRVVATESAFCIGTATASSSSRNDSVSESCHS